MPWCPVCKNEYREGFTECADCHAALTSKLKASREEVVTFGEEEEMTTLKDFLVYSGFTSATVEYDEAEEVYEVFVVEEDLKRAKRAAKVFMEQEAAKKEEREEIEETQIEEQEEPVIAPVYENRKEKAENFKSSALTLLVVGIIGVVVLLLSALGILPFTFATLTSVVMGLLFVIFIITGILSFGSYQKIAKEAVTENNLSEEIKEWCKENLTAEIIDHDLFTEDSTLSEEMKYFVRVDKMKQMITRTYVALEDGFLEAIVEDVYPMLFEA